MHSIKLQIIGVKSTLDFNLCMLSLEQQIGFPYEEARNIVFAAKAQQKQTIEFPSEISEETIVSNLRNVGLLIRNRRI